MHPSKYLFLPPKAAEKTSATTLSGNIITVWVLLGVPKPILHLSLGATRSTQSDFAFKDSGTKYVGSRVVDFIFVSDVSFREQRFCHMQSTQYYQ